MASLSMAQEVLICDRCNISPVQKYCNKCDTSLCDGCVVKHISSDKTKSHDIVTYELKKEDPIYPDCSNHNKQQCEMFCKECDIPICVKCITSGSHRNHQVTDILDIFNSEKDAIFQDTETLETSIYLDNKELLKSKRFSEMKKYKSKIPEFTKSPTEFDVTPPTFTPAPIGHIETASSVSIPPKQKPIDSPKVRSDFNIGYGDLYDIACHSPDDIWVTGNDENIKRFNHKGDLQQTITPTTGIMPGGITVTLQGELIYTDLRDGNIYIVRNGKPQKMITVQGWRSRKLCYTAAGELLVSMIKDDQTPKKVVRYRGSTEKEVLQFDQDGKHWFSIGYSALFIDEKRNGDLCASDYMAKQIVVINAAGKLRFRYTGNLSANKYTSFYPHGIATDSESQILVADYNNNCIHIISEDGHFIRYIDNGQLSRPWDLSLDKNNTLYVTEHGTGKVKMIEYMK